MMMMHTRNPYKDGIDFQDLAHKYPPLAPFVVPSIDFTNEQAQRTLTQAILHVDFGVRLELPEDRLCPPVPNRLNYVLWIQDLVACVRGARGLLAVPGGDDDDDDDNDDDNGEAGDRDREERVVGLDVGTGASAIYPLLACKLDSTWDMLATEIDSHSLSYARMNVDKNGLQDRIRVFDASSSPHIFGPLFDSSGEDEDSSQALFGQPKITRRRKRMVDFTMCNPPFYSSVEDISASRDVKASQALSTCTGSQNEMIYPPTLGLTPKTTTSTTTTQHVSRALQEGGEVAFVARMVDESVVLRGRCGWYTSMLGKLSSVPKVVGLFKALGITNYAVTEFVQGKTRRWGVGWTLGGWRVSDDLGRLSHIPRTHVLYKCQPERTTYDYTVVVLPPRPRPRPAPLRDIAGGSGGGASAAGGVGTGTKIPAERTNDDGGDVENAMNDFNDDMNRTAKANDDNAKSLPKALNHILETMNVEFHDDTTIIAARAEREGGGEGEGEREGEGKRGLVVVAVVVVRARENTWSRAVRRAGKRKWGGSAVEGEGGGDVGGEGGEGGGGRGRSGRGVKRRKEKRAPGVRVGSPQSGSAKVEGSPESGVTAEEGKEEEAVGGKRERDDDDDGVPYKMMCTIRVLLAHDDGGNEDDDEDAKVGDVEDNAGEERRRRRAHGDSSSPTPLLPPPRPGSYTLRFQWVYGFDRGMFEGFASHVGRKVGAGMLSGGAVGGG